jgi:hypothetical protein
MFEDGVKHVIHQSNRQRQDYGGIPLSFRKTSEPIATEWASVFDDLISDYVDMGKIMQNMVAPLVLIAIYGDVKGFMVICRSEAV